MRTPCIPACLILAALPVVAGGARFKPIPAEVWSLPQETALGTGAVHLDLAWTFGNDGIDLELRTRVLAAGGKTVMNDFQLPEQACEFEGRVVTRDGREVPLDVAKDVIRKAVARSEDNQETVVLAIPAGITDDCVIDLRCRIPTVWRGGAGSFKSDWTPPEIRLARGYPILRETLTIEKGYRYAYRLTGMGDAESLPGQDVHVLRKVPAETAVPFAAEAYRDRPRIAFFPVPVALLGPYSQGREAFWSASGDLYFKWYFEGVVGSWTYQKWAAGLLRDLPATPQAAAAELARRLDARIRNVDEPTWAEADAHARVEGTVKSKDLDSCVKAGRTDAPGMCYLYLRLLKDAGIPARVVFLADRDRVAMTPQRLDVTQWTRVAVGVPEAGKPLLLVDPALRFAPPGMIPTRYQGTLALSFDAASWDPGFIAVPIQADAGNRRTYRCRLDLEDEGERFEVEASLTGLPGYMERRKAMVLAPEAQGGALRTRLERANPSLQIRAAEVRHVLTPELPLEWSCKGFRGCEKGGSRELEPFPGVPRPFDFPESWPKVRKDAIAMPELGVLEAEARFVLPAGLRLLPEAPWERSNGFGKVRWSLASTTGKDGEEVRVGLRIETGLLLAKADQYEALKQFVGWVKEAWERRVVMRER